MAVKHVPPPGANDIYRRYADACFAADVAFLKHHITIHENWLARQAARAVRDADLILLRRQEEFT